MQKNRYIKISVAAVAILMLILDSKTALQGAVQGVNLCIYTVIPSLFPLFVFSYYLTNELNGASLGFMRKIASICGVPKGGESLLLVGLIGGYPVGAQCIKKAYDAKCISKADAQRLLGFCSNAGPAFIFGATGLIFPMFWTSWLLWGIQILSAVITGMLLPNKKEYMIQQSASGSVAFIDALKHSVIAMANICAWVMLFRIGITFLSKWFLRYFPAFVQATINGCMELVNGCYSLYAVQNDRWRFIMCSIFLSWGGLCVCMQTMSVVGDLGIVNYLKGKLLQTAISGLLSTMIASLIYPGNDLKPLGISALLLFLVLFPVKFKKSVAFTERMIYNTKKSL